MFILGVGGYCCTLLQSYIYGKRAVDEESARRRNLYKITNSNTTDRHPRSRRGSKP